LRVLAAQQRPDHATIARFIERHQDAIAGLFGEVLTLCAGHGLAKVGVIAVDGTKVPANASRDANRDYAQLAREILEEARAVDAAEDELYGDARGDELPEQLRTGEGRRAWLREAKRRLEERRAKEAPPVPGERPKRLKEAKRRLEEELWTEVRANEAYERYRSGRMKDGRRFGRRPDPSTPPAMPQGQINTSDPDSRLIKGPRGRGFLQGYNAQAVANEHQIVIAAEVMTAAPDFGHSSRCSTPPSASSRPPASTSTRPSSSLTPAIGIGSRWSISSIAASRCSSRPTPRAARARAPAGTAAFTPSCAGSCRPSAAASSTANANR
jgi:hypothetical protein